MRKIFVFVMAVLLIGGISRAADSTKFGVTSYVPEKFQDLEWRLNGNFSLQGTDREDVTLYESGTNESTSRSGAITSNLRYQWYTPQQFFNMSLGLSGHMDYRHAKGNSTLQLSDVTQNRSGQSSTHELDLEGSPRFEFGRYLAKDFFLGLSGEGLFARYEYINHGVSSFTNYDDGSVIGSWRESYRRERVDSRVHLSGGSIVGWGRVYSGAYAVTIEEVIRSLEHAGLLLRQPTKSEYLILCDTIYSLRKRHSFDGRENQIAAVRSIAELLAQSGITTQGILPALLVQDVWTYYPRADRQFGWRVYGGPVAIWDWSRQSTYYSDYSYPYQWTENSDGAWGIRGTAEYFRPVSLRLQFDASLDVFLVSEDWRMRNTPKHYEGYRGQADVKYYFDSRTGGIVHLARLQNPSPLDGLPALRPSVYIPYDSWGASTNQTYRVTELMCELSHRISPPTTMSITFQQYWWSLNYRNAINRHEHSGYNIAMAFTHWLY